VTPQARHCVREEGMTTHDGPVAENRGGLSRLLSRLNGRRDYFLRIAAIAAGIPFLAEIPLIRAFSATGRLRSSPMYVP
jgi:hypothetical protein